MDFQNFTKIQNFWRQLLEFLNILKPTLGSFGPDRFSRFDVFWDKQTPRQASYIYLWIKELKNREK